MQMDTPVTKSGKAQRYARAVLISSLGLGAALALPAAAPAAFAQTAAAPATTVAPQRGTVKAISGSTLTVATDAGPTITISVPDAAKVQKLAPGSTDLKTATASQLSDVAVGDRILASVRAGDSPDSFTARTLVLMKSGDIAQANAAEQADWRRNGIGGIVASVDPGGSITVTSGAKKITITTSPKTDYRRFSGDSTEYKDAKPGTLAEIHAGDQIQARGVKSEDGLTVQANQVVSGSFKNLSGLITNLDPSLGKITIKDLASKKTYTVTVSANSNLRAMPPQMAAMFAGRTGAGAGSAQGGAPAAQGAGGPGGGQGGAPAAQGAGPGGGQGGGQGGPGAGPGGGGRRPGGGGGGDLSQMISRLPTTTLASLKNGDAVLIVASEPSPGSTNVTAVTLLSGVEPILTANPNGGVNLGGWSMGGGAPTE